MSDVIHHDDMTSIDALILDAREARAALIDRMLLNHQAVVSIKANIPGQAKQVPEAYLLVRYACARFRTDDAQPITLIDGPDGPGFLFGYQDKDAEGIKKTACLLEEMDPWGRLIDIDVYGKSGILSRPQPRTCLLCDRPAFDCIRNHRHSEDDVKRQVTALIEDRLPEIVEKVIRESIQAELDLHPKFGLVTPFSTGSHPDMDYTLMKRASETIIPFLEKMFFAGWGQTDLEVLLPKIRAKGIAAEQAMLESTGGINAYRGLIFSLGLMLASCGYSLGRAGDFSDLFTTVAKMTTGLTTELLSGGNSDGKTAYQRYHITGARGEAEQGFPSVREALFHLKTDSWEDRMRTLTFLIGRVEDTVLLKRCGSFEKYREVQDTFANWKDYSSEALEELTKRCMANRLSFGGSADLLALSIFVRKFSTLFYFWHQDETAFTNS